jgi:hypothetical protein
MDGTAPRIKFKSGHRVEADEWSLDGEKISSPEKLLAIKKVLETEGPVLVDLFFPPFYGPCVLESGPFHF